MEMNPYESPRVGDPLAEQSLPSSDSIRQLLVEIRDAQRQTAEYLRQAEVRHQRNAGFTRWMPVLSMIFLAIVIGSSLFRIWRPFPFPTPPAYRPPVRAPQ